MKTAGKYNRIVIVLLFLYAALQVYCIQQLTLNADEGSFASYGITILKGQAKKDIVAFDSKLPVTAFNMLPRAVEQIFNPSLKRSWPESTIDIIRGRYISLVVTIFLALLVFRWTTELYGEKAGLFSLVFFLLSPDFLAHGIFVSSDIYAAFFLPLTIYFAWKYSNSAKLSHHIWLSLACAFAQISKFSMFHLFIIIPVLLVITAWYKRNTGRKFPVVTIAGRIALFLFINWLVISAAHLFYQLFLPIGDYHFRSNAFLSLQKLLPGAFPVPLPSSYVQSMDAVMYFDQIGGGAADSLNGPSYILGKNDPDGFWYYYLVTMFYKQPIPLLVIWIASLIIVVVKFNRERFFRKEIFLLLPFFYYLLYLSLFYKTQLGIRHIIMVFPLLLVLSGRFFELFTTGKKQGVIYILIVLQAVSVGLYLPHFLPYTNEFIPDKKRVYKKMADSSIGYGEGGKYLAKYLAQNPDAVYQPERPVAGKIIIEAGQLAGLPIASMHKFDWAKNLQPVDHIHSQYLVFSLDQKQVDSLNHIYRSQNLKQ